MTSPFVICGATGNIGSKIAAELLAAGEPVRVVGRERARLGPLAARGAEPWRGDIADSAFLEKALEGARGVFVLIPPKFDAPDFRGYQARIADAVVSAVEKSRVPRVVCLSSVGAHLASGNGPIRGLHDLERKLDDVRPAAVVHLRPAYFMENHLFGIPVISGQGIYGSPVRRDVPMPMIATKDIADAGARILRDEAHAGHTVRYLLGPRDLTMTEATRILGRAIGKPDLRYVQFAEDEARKGLLAMGASPSVAETFLEMERGFNSGLIRPTEGRTPGNSTPTTLEEFADTVFAPTYTAAA